MKRFTLCIGCANAFQTVLRIVYPRFESLTFLNGEGASHGEHEPVLRVQVITRDGESVIAAAEAIRRELGQIQVGIEHGGRYYRCHEGDPATALQRQLALEHASGMLRIERRPEFTCGPQRQRCEASGPVESATVDKGAEEDARETADLNKERSFGAVPMHD